MVFNATFNNISVISWWSILQVEKIGAHRENHALPQVTDKKFIATVMLYLFSIDLRFPCAKLFVNRIGIIQQNKDLTVKQYINSWKTNEI
jgi:hypothetical protein